MDDIAKSGHKSGHLMLITPERVFYAGLLGRPRARCSGAFNVYVAIEGGLSLTTADGRETFCELAAVLPNIRHTIASDYRSVLSLVIEPESVPSGVFEDLVKRLSGPESSNVANRIRAAMSPCASVRAATISPMPNSICCASAKSWPRARSIRGWRARSCRSENSAASR